MKKITLFTLLILTLLISTAFAQRNITKWREVTPKKFARKTLIKVSENERTYYAVSKEEKVTFEVKGPAKIRVLTRLGLPKIKAESYKYAVSYKRDGKKKKTKKLNTKASKLAFMGDVPLGQSRSFYLKVPAGKHKYTFFSDGSQIYLRLFRKKYEWISYNPKGKNDIVILQHKEKELPYVRLKSGEEVSLELFGPTKIKIISRLEYAPQMTGERSYRLQIMEKGEVLNSYTLTTYKSETTTYKEKLAFVPAKGRTFYFNVPKGKHLYKFKLLDADSSVLLRFFIPKDHINNSAK